jgi:hypothetical protein
MNSRFVNNRLKPKRRHSTTMRPLTGESYKTKTAFYQKAIMKYFLGSSKDTTR